MSRSFVTHLFVSVLLEAVRQRARVQPGRRLDDAFSPPLEAQREPQRHLHLSLRLEGTKRSAFAREKQPGAHRESGGAELSATS